VFAGWCGGRAVVVGVMVALGCSGDGGGTMTADAALDGPMVDHPPAIERPPADVVPDRAGPDVPLDARPPDAPPDGPSDTRIYPDVTPAELTLSPPAFDFASVPVTTSASHSFVLENLGQLGSGTPSVNLTGTTDDSFQIVSNQCEAPLDPGARCTIEIAFSPITTGRRSALLEAEAAPGGRVSSQLDGTGVAP
jgi:hypothetical protein